MAKLTIESNEELMKLYGLATALYSTADYLLTEYIRLEGKLNDSNPQIIKKLLENKTFGPKIELAKMLIVDNDLLKSELDLGLKDRNMLAHGVSVDRDGESLLMFREDFHPLKVENLNQIITRARTLIDNIIIEIQKKFKLKTP